MNAFDKPVIFVGGAPRSGTTVAQALLCTSDRTNRYVPEASFLLPFFNAYRIGIENWAIHTAAFYKTQDLFRDHMLECVRKSLADISRAMGNPEVLCIKDPLLTPFFYWVHELLGEQVRFVTVVRNPYDIVRSRQEVEEREGRPLTKARAYDIATEINRSYTHLKVNKMARAVFALRYEDLTQPETIRNLQAFTGLPDICPDKVWTEGREVNRSAEKGAWFSPKYHRPIDLERRLQPLGFQFRRIVRKVCNDLIVGFNYESIAVRGLSRFRRSFS